MFVSVGDPEFVRLHEIIQEEARARASSMR